MEGFGGRHSDDGASSSDEQVLVGRNEALLRKAAEQGLRLAADMAQASEWKPIETVGEARGERVDLWVVRLSSSGKHHDEHRAPDCYMKNGRWHSRWQDARGYAAIEKHYTPTHWMERPRAPASGIEARSDEPPVAAQPERQEPDGEAGTHI